jgi:hypothetical protein
MQHSSQAYSAALLFLVALCSPFAAAQPSYSGFMRVSNGRFVDANCREFLFNGEFLAVCTASSSWQVAVARRRMAARVACGTVRLAFWLHVTHLDAGWNGWKLLDYAANKVTPSGEVHTADGRPAPWEVEFAWPAVQLRIVANVLGPTQG